MLKQLTDRSYSVVSQGQVLCRHRKHLLPQAIPVDVDHPTASLLPQAVPVDIDHPTASLLPQAIPVDVDHPTASLLPQAVPVDVSRSTATLPPQAIPMKVDHPSAGIDQQDQETGTTKSGRLVKKPVCIKTTSLKLEKGVW